MNRDEEVAEQISRAYIKAKDRNEFFENLSQNPGIYDKALSRFTIFSLCNKVWQGGYNEGYEDRETYS